MKEAIIILIILLSLIPSALGEEKKIILTTGNLRDNYEILGIVAVEGDTENYLFENKLVRPEQLLYGVVAYHYAVLDARRRFEEEARKLGGDAVIYIKFFPFERDVHHLVVGYGTVVRFKK